LARAPTWPDRRGRPGGLPSLPHVRLPEWWSALLPWRPTARSGSRRKTW